MPWKITTRALAEPRLAAREWRGGGLGGLARHGGVGLKIMRIVGVKKQERHQEMLVQRGYNDRRTFLATLQGQCGRREGRKKFHNIAGPAQEEKQ